MSAIFETQVITTAGRNLIAQATATNPLAFTKVRYSQGVPSYPEVDTSWYEGSDGWVDEASATNNVARIVAAFPNTTSPSAITIRGVAIFAKLQSQPDANAVVFAYGLDADSTIQIPTDSAPAQITRFAFNIIIDPEDEAQVVDAGSASLADLDRYVSLHKAGQPYVGEAQLIYGHKTFQSSATFIVDISVAGASTLTGDVTFGGNLCAAGDSEQNIGSPDNRFQEIYCTDVNLTSSIVFPYNNTSGRAYLYQDDDGTIAIDNADLVIGTGSRKDVYCGTLYSNKVQARNLYLPSPSYIYDSVNGASSYHVKNGRALMFDAGSSDGNIVLSRLDSDETFTVSTSTLAEVNVEEEVESGAGYYGTEVTVPIGALVMAIPSSGWISAHLNTTFYSGHVLTLDDGEFFTCEWVKGSSSSNGSKICAVELETSVGSPQRYRWLKGGQYRLLCGIKAAESTATLEWNGSAIFMQRIA